MKSKLILLAFTSLATLAIAADVTWGPQQAPAPAVLTGYAKPIVVSGAMSIEDISKSLTVDGCAPVSIQMVPQGNKYRVTAQYRKANPAYVAPVK